MANKLNRRQFVTSAAVGLAAAAPPSALGRGPPRYAHRAALRRSSSPRETATAIRTAGPRPAWRLHSG